MPCYHPMYASRSPFANENGKFPVRFKRAVPIHALYSHFKPFDGDLTLPCGQCAGCRLEKSRQWAIRCMHEASLHENNCFITLTYDDQHLPGNRSLDKQAMPLFMKRLRKKFGSGIRVYYCGEYGDTYGRPHYHACLFNHDFDDKIIHSQSNGIPLYTSTSLQSLWKFGFSTVGTLTFESAAYCARYVMKKIYGAPASEHYGDRHPEFCQPSRSPGLARGWYDKYIKDVYPHDYVVVRGKKMKPPKYYDRLYEFDYPSDFEDLKLKRLESAEKKSDDNTPERLAIKEKVKHSQLKHLVRNVDLIL